MDSTTKYLDTASEHAPCGLREKKRLETLCAIEDHATRLVLDRGYDDVTVEDICEAAGISKRTFFNYVDSKDTAIVGNHEIHISEKDKAEFLNSAPEQLLTKLIKLQLQTIITRGRSSAFSSILLRRRKAILRLEPSLVNTRLSITMHRFRYFSGIVEEYFDLHPEARTIRASEKHRPFDPNPESTSAKLVTHSRGKGTPSREAELTSPSSDEAIALTFIAENAIQQGTMNWMRREADSADIEELIKLCNDALVLIRTVVNAHPLDTSENS